MERRLDFGVYELVPTGKGDGTYFIVHKTTHQTFSASNGKTRWFYDEGASVAEAKSRREGR